MITNDRDCERRLASHIIHPVFRYMEVALSNSVFIRGESTSKLTFPELSILKCMLFHEEDRPHIGHFLCNHIHSISHNKKPGGQISIGPIVTIFAN